MEMKFKYYKQPNFTIAETKLRKHRKSSIYYRPHTTDSGMISESLQAYGKIPFNDNDVCLDFGANIGGFCAIASPIVKEIYAYEPDEFNYAVLEYNTKDMDNVNLFKSAVVGDVSKTVTFQFRDNGNAASSGKVATNKIKSNFRTVDVPAVNFEKTIIQTNANFIKMDIEGGEYNTIVSHIPNRVNKLAIELHGSSKEDFIRMIRFIDYLQLNWQIKMFEPISYFGKIQACNIYLERIKYTTDKFSVLQYVNDFDHDLLKLENKFFKYSNELPTYKEFIKGLKC